MEPWCEGESWCEKKPECKRDADVRVHRVDSKETTPLIV
jgi:hypothetical protein